MKHLLFILALSMTISLAAQEKQKYSYKNRYGNNSAPAPKDSYALDSLESAPAAATAAADLSQSKPSKSGGSSSSMAIFKTLFGLGLHAGYSFTSGDYELEPGISVENKDRYLPVNNYKTNNAYLKVSLTTPIITFSQTWTTNSFSNQLTENLKYNKTHFDFFGLSRLGIYLDKYKRIDIKDKLLLAELLLPYFDRSHIQSSNIDDKEWRIGVLNNMFAYSRKEFHTQNVSFLYNGQPVNGFNVDCKYSRISIFDAGACMEQMSSFYLHLYRHFSTLGADNDELEGMMKAMKLQNYCPMPLFSCYFPSGEFSLKNSLGKELYYAKLGSLVGFTFGLQYCGNFFIKSLNLAIVPRIAWQPIDFQASTKTKEEKELKGDEVFTPCIRSTYFNASIGAMYIF